MAEAGPGPELMKVKKVRKKERKKVMIEKKDWKRTWKETDWKQSR